MQDPGRPAAVYPFSLQHQPNGGQFPQPGAAYPYAADQPQNPPYNDNLTSSGNFFTRSFIRAFLITFVCLFLHIGVALLIIWLVFNPSLPAFQVDSFTVSNLSTGPQSVTGTWQVGLVALNRDKKVSITYHDLKPYLSYKAAFLSEAQVQHFTQDKKSQDILNITFSATNTYVGEELVNDIKKEKDSGSIAFDVDLASTISFSLGGWRWRKHFVRISCENIPVVLSSITTSALFVGGSKNCYATYGGFDS